ncbi:alpha/beta-hydrolase [Penicillium argentinense]|uniref:Alpha/beta-hydrolase n=1 Tax=Penicillium argentinense TaxID=1131581 RepID=A0A9W9FE06_9EURO|nr:alpha/beta-hydrolase [Penicillium argentinense]KAJ5098495.1 alpha/beta-hydrolase [Penicillium argentinense]
MATLSVTDLPLLIYLHGGGYVTGGQETDDKACRALAPQIPVLALNVEYRLVTEHPFPIGFEDSFDVVRWGS